MAGRFKFLSPVQPYYERDGITIYHGDCRDVLPTLALANCVLLTDPVYGVNGGSGGDVRKYGKALYERSGWTDDEPYVREVCVPVVEYLLERAVRGAVTPGNRCLMFYPRPRDIGCFWTPASATTSSWGLTTFHPILYYGRDFRGGRGAWPTGRQVVGDKPEHLGHPCPKPVKAWQWLAAKVAEPNDLVIDPFLGSGTTTRVAKNLGLRAIGIEIEERYCEIAVKRLAQEVMFAA